jgi:hypothetical protein
MIDVKKLITGFLILAVAGSAAAFLIGNIGNSSAAAQTAIIANSGTATTDSPVSGNAFARDPSGGTASIADTVVLDDPNFASTSDAILNDPNNLTGQLTETYITNLMDANPTVDQTAEAGTGSLTAPDDATVIDQFAQTSTLAEINPPDWDTEADQIPITVAPNFSSSSITSYTTAIQDVFNQDFVQPNLTDLVNNNGDPSAGAFVEPKLQSALQDIAGLQTPKPAVAFQKSLVKLLVYEKNTAALTQNDTVDPVKTALTFQLESPKYDSAVANYETQFNALAAVNGFAPIAQAAPTGPVAFVDSMLGIKSANAIFGLGDITFDPTQFAQVLKNYAENIILQITKNIVVGLIQKTALKWVQGNGVPKFIQNWGTTLVNAYTRTALSALNSQMQCVNGSPFAPQVKLVLGAYYQTNNNICAVQFNAQLGNNLNKFYNNFSSGGWLAFGQTLQPDNNYYGQLYFTAQVINNTAQNAQQSAQAKAVANQGWTGKSVCLSPGGNAIDPSTGCNIGDKINADSECVSANGGKTYDPVDVGIQTGDDGDSESSCPDGYDSQILQPGQVTNQVFNSAIDDSGKLTAGANDIAGLLDSVLSSLLNSIATDVITTTSGAINSLGNGGGTSGTTSNNSNGSTSITLQCVVTPDIPADGGFTFSASGGNIINSNGSQTTPQYTWLAPFGANPTTGTGSFFQTSFNATGTYSVLLTDTVDATSTTCTATY